MEMMTRQQVSKNRIRLGMALPLQMVETEDELSALPLKSMVRELFNQPPMNGDRGKTWERRRNGWTQISGFEGDGSDRPALPVCLLWHPRWREILSPTAALR